VLRSVRGSAGPVQARVVTSALGRCLRGAALALVLVLAAACAGVSPGPGGASTPVTSTSSSAPPYATPSTIPLAALSNRNRPGPLVNFSAGYDPVSQRLILFGGQEPGSATGSGLSAATWAWDGRGWARLTPTNAPPAQIQASMAVDPISGHLLLVGGDAYSGGVNAAGQWVDHWAPTEGTWLWDGSNWNPWGRQPGSGRLPGARRLPAHSSAPRQLPAEPGRTRAWFAHDSP
jgi:hypothetical protein